MSPEDLALALVRELRELTVRRLPDWWTGDPDARLVIELHPELAQEPWIRGFPAAPDEGRYTVIWHPDLDGGAVDPSRPRGRWRAACDDVIAAGMADLAAELLRQIREEDADELRVLLALRDDLDLAGRWPWGATSPAGAEMLRTLTRSTEPWPAAEVIREILHRPTHVPMPVDAPPRRTLTTIAGGHRRRDLPTARKDAEDTTITLTWPDDGGQIELPYLEHGARGVLAALGRHYRGDAVRLILTLYALGWAARAPAGATWLWWPAESAGLCGLRDNNAAARMRAIAEELARVRVDFRIRKQARSEPLIDLREIRDSGRPMRDVVDVRLARCLWAGMTDEDGRPGRAWSLMPLLLPAARTSPRPSRHDAAVLLIPFALGFRWRAALSDRRDLGEPILAYARAEDLAGELGLAADTAELARVLDAARDLDACGPWRMEDGLIYVEPSAYHAEVAAGEHLSRPPSLPATGPDLMAWCERRGLAAAAEALGVQPATLRQWRRRYPLALTWPVRRRVLSALWPGLPWPDRG